MIHLKKTLLIFCSGCLFSQSLFAANTLTSNHTTSEQLSTQNTSQIQVDLDEALPEVIQALNKLPPEKTIEILNQAMKDISDLNELISRNRNEIREVLKNPSTNELGNLIYEIKVPVYITSGVLMAGSLIRDLYLMESDEKEPSKIFRFQKAHRTFYFWGSFALMAAEYIHNEYREDLVTLDQTQMKNLKSEINSFQREIDRRYKIIDTLMQFQTIKMKTTNKKSVTTTNDIEISR